jgi:sulfotransferase
MREMYFISGLPRAGSTLLSSILNQNPEFYASISGPLARFVRSVVEEKETDSSRNEAILKTIIENYYPDDKIYFDTNRGYGLLTKTLKSLYPYTKIIMCVRDVNWVLDSFEQLARKSPYNSSLLFSDAENVNVYTRIDSLTQSSRTVGFAYDSLKQAICSTERDMIHLVEYDDLAKNPEKVMRRLYKFIGKDYFNHDFNNVEATYDEFDQDVNLPGLHTVRNKVEFQHRKMILPPDIQMRFKNMEVWK